MPKDIKHAVHFSSGKDNWETPDNVFNYFNKTLGYNFEVDAAAEPTNAKTPVWYGIQENGFFIDGLEQDWSNKRIWLNPPYSKTLQPRFLKKALQASDLGARVVCLLPARTDTKMWHEYVMKADQVYFIKGRLQFKGSNASAPFPSCVVIFQNGAHRPRFFSLDKKEIK